MSLKSHAELLANYNQWMNKSIYHAASTLSTSDLKKDRGAFFHSILGTLNHIVVGDIIWLKRFAEHSSDMKALDYIRELQRPQTLDTVLHLNFDDLLEIRKKLDHTITLFSHDLTDTILNSDLSYHNMKGKPFTQNMGQLVLHFFNHQTHHRGQVSTLLNQAGVDIGVTDLVIHIPETQP